MYPWLWFWAPQVHFPWSGDVAQRIEPNTFFQGINAQAGNARIEEKAFGVASYGKQLGYIEEILIELAEQSELKSPESVNSLEKLRAIRYRIENIKNAEYEAVAAHLETQLSELKQKGGERYAALAKRLVRLLNEDGT